MGFKTNTVLYTAVVVGAVIGGVYLSPYNLTFILRAIASGLLFILAVICSYVLTINVLRRLNK